MIVAATSYRYSFVEAAVYRTYFWESYVFYDI